MRAVVVQRPQPLGLRVGGDGCHGASGKQSGRAAGDGERPRKTPPLHRPSRAQPRSILPDVRGGALRQRAQMVAAFERGDDAALGVPVGDLHQLPGDPRVVVLDRNSGPPCRRRDARRNRRK